MIPAPPFYYAPPPLFLTTPASTRQQGRTPSKNINEWIGSVLGKGKYFLDIWKWEVPDCKFSQDGKVCGKTGKNRS